MKQITVKIDDSSLIEYGVEVAKSMIIERLFTILKSENFAYYLGNRMTSAVLGIATLQTSSIKEDVISSKEIGDYLNSFKTEINGDTIFLYNDSVINTATKQISPANRANYPLQLSLSKLIEYGFGYTGWLNTNPVPENWQYDVNEHGYKGWYYEDSAGQLHWTNGMEGRLVFLRLCWWLEKNFTDVVSRYLKNNL